MNLQHSVHGSMNLVQEQSAVLQPVLKPQLTRLSTSSGEANCPAGIYSGRNSGPLIFHSYCKGSKSGREGMPAAFHNVVL